MEFPHKMLSLGKETVQCMSRELIVRELNPIYLIVGSLSRHVVTPMLPELSVVGTSGFF